MRALSPLPLLVFLALTASSALAESELEALRRRCQLQQEKIRQLESRLGISTSVSEAPAKTAAAEAVYLVVAGDTLAGIARTHGCSVDDLLAANQLKANALIHPGQSIRIPAAKPASTPSEASRAAVASSVATLTYQVVSGDTFSSIARAHGLSLDQLLAANPEVKPTALRPGQTIRLAQAPPSQAGPPESAAGKVPTGTTTVSVPTSPPKRKIQPVRIQRAMTYREFAALQGTTTRRLNQLNGLDLIDAAKLVKGTELLAPTIIP